MLNCLLLALKAICCMATAESEIKSSKDPCVCLPLNCALAIKDCYYKTNATVHPEHSDIELSGAPAEHSMA
jgi:hypothetical protein